MEEKTDEDNTIYYEFYDKNKNSGLNTHLTDFQDKAYEIYENTGFDTPQKINDFFVKLDELFADSVGIYFEINNNKILPKIEEKDSIYFYILFSAIKINVAKKIKDKSKIEKKEFSLFTHLKPTILNEENNKNKELIELIKKIDTLNNQIKTTEERLTEQQNQNRKLQTELEKMTTSTDFDGFEEKDANILNQENRKLQEKIETMEIDNRHLKKWNDNLNKQIEDIKSENISLTEKNETLTTKNQDLTDQIEGLTKNNIDARFFDNLNQLTEKHNLLENENQRLRDSIELLSQNIKELKESKANLINKIKQRHEMAKAKTNRTVFSFSKAKDEPLLSGISGRGIQRKIIPKRTFKKRVKKTLKE